MAGEIMEVNTTSTHDQHSQQCGLPYIPPSDYTVIHFFVFQIEFDYLFFSFLLMLNPHKPKHRYGSFL